MNHCIQVEHLHKTFQRRQGKRKETIHAVKDVSFHLEAGDSLGIIGSSGCGKSTLVKMILGILKPDQGKVTTAAKVGFVGQDPYASLCPTMKIEKIVAEPLLFTGKKKTYKQCREEVEKVMSFVHLDLEKYGKRLPSQLSGGERQRVGHRQGADFSAGAFGDGRAYVHAGSGSKGGNLRDHSADFQGVSFRISDGNS